MANEQIAEQPVDPHRRLLKQTPRLKACEIQTRPVTDTAVECFGPVSTCP